MNRQNQVFSGVSTFSVFLPILLGLLFIVGATGVKAGAPADFDGDGKTDISVFRPSDGFWYVAKSTGGFSSVQWGLSNDSLVPGDYDGDGKTDLAVYRIVSDTVSPNNTYDYIWHIRRSSDTALLSRRWGKYLGLLGFDAPKPADYDGDGRTDLAVYYLSDAVGSAGNFKILNSASDSPVNVEWGLNTDSILPGDYDGDGKADLAVYRGTRFNTEINLWYILESSTNTVRIERFGLVTDRRVPADYDGDGKTDIAVFRPSNGFWYRINTRDNLFGAVQFGLSDDKLVPGDYDGDGRTDLAVFRPSNATWYLNRSTAGFTAQQFGLSSDVPIPGIAVR